MRMPPPSKPTRRSRYLDVGHPLDYVVGAALEHRAFQTRLRLGQHMLGLPTVVNEPAGVSSVRMLHCQALNALRQQQQKRRCSGAGVGASTRKPQAAYHKTVDGKVQASPKVEKAAPYCIVWS